jgi:hypothetical protein
MRNALDGVGMQVAFSLAMEFMTSVTLSYRISHYCWNISGVNTIPAPIKKREFECVWCRKLEKFQGL